MCCSILPLSSCVGASGASRISLAGVQRRAPFVFEALAFLLRAFMRWILVDANVDGTKGYPIEAGYAYPTTRSSATSFRSTATPSRE